MYYYEHVIAKETESFDIQIKAHQQEIKSLKHKRDSYQNNALKKIFQKNMADKMKIHDQIHELERKVRDTELDKLRYIDVLTTMPINLVCKVLAKYLTNLIGTEYIHIIDVPHHNQKECINYIASTNYQQTLNDENQSVPVDNDELLSELRSNGELLIVTDNIGNHFLKETVTLRELTSDNQLFYEENFGLVDPFKGYHHLPIIIQKILDIYLQQNKEVDLSDIDAIVNEISGVDQQENKLKKSLQ